MKTVKCNKCQEHCVPRLWHVNINSYIFNRSTQHICPFCGEVMYTSGGGVSLLAKGLVSVFLFLLIASIFGNIIQSIFGASHGTAFTWGYIFSFALLVFILKNKIKQKYKSEKDSSH